MKAHLQLVAAGWAVAGAAFAGVVFDPTSSRYVRVFLGLAGLACTTLLALLSSRPAVVEARASLDPLALSKLAPGIAHEMNTPIQYIQDSLHFVREGVVELMEPGGDIEYLRKELPLAMDRALEGIGRIAAMVASVKRVASAPEQIIDFNLNETVESTLLVARNEYKYVADLQTELEPSLVFVHAQPLAIVQALLASVIGAAASLDGQGRGRIVVRTRTDDEHAIVEVGVLGSRSSMFVVRMPLATVIRPSA